MTEVRITAKPLRVTAHVPEVRVDLSCEACGQRPAVDFIAARWLCGPCIAIVRSERSGGPGVVRDA